MAQAKQRILCIRCLGAFLETGLLHPPLAALRLFPRTIEIKYFQNFNIVLKIRAAWRKYFRHAERRGSYAPPACTLVLILGVRSRNVLRLFMGFLPEHRQEGVPLHGLVLQQVLGHLLQLISLRFQNILAAAVGAVH